MSLAMTVQQRTAAHLITDAGTWHEDGTCGWLGSKVAAFPSLRAAVSCSGRNPYPQRILDGAAKARVTTLRELLVAMPDIVRSMAEEDTAKDGKEAELSAFLVTFDPIHGPATFMICTARPDMPDYVPFTTIRLRAMIDVGDASAILGRPVDICDPESFDVALDGLALAFHARDTPWTARAGAEGYFVAGFVELTTVDATGVHTQRLCEWPGDRVGEKTNPFRHAA